MPRSRAQSRCCFPRAYRQRRAAGFGEAGPFLHPTVSLGKISWAALVIESKSGSTTHLKKPTANLGRSVTFREGFAYSSDFRAARLACSVTSLYGIHLSNRVGQAQSPRGSGLLDPGVAFADQPGAQAT